MKRFLSTALAFIMILSLFSCFSAAFSAAETKNGIIKDSDGEIRYYENGVPVYKKLVKFEDGYYYFNSSKKAVRNTRYAFSESAAGGLLPAGEYSFGADGKLIEGSNEDGVVFDYDGEIRYYENNVSVYKKLVKSGNDYYYFNSAKKAVRNTRYAFSESAANGLLPAGEYSFGSDGKLIEGSNEDGVVFDYDGEIRYYENNVPVYKKLVKFEDGYYYFNSAKKAVRNTRYAFSEFAANGLLPAGEYTFGADGKIIESELPEPDEPVKKPDPEVIKMAEDALLTVPDYYEIYYTEETAAAVSSAAKALETGKNTMTKAEAETAVKNLEDAVAALVYKNTDILQIFITTDGTEITDSYTACKIEIVPTDRNETPYLLDEFSQVKVRGNSTALASKKPFNIRLSEKQDICGMGSSRKWALLANAFDKSLIRNQIALGLGNDLGVDYMSSSTFADVWVNGKLLGNYTLVENVEAGSSRVDIDPNAGDYLLEYEAHREESDVEYVETGRYRMRFALNEPEILTSEQRSEVTAYLSAFENALASGDWSRVEAVADIDSFVNFYILSEFAKQVDFAFSSTRFFIKDGVMHAGPGWDYDLSMGNVGAREYDDYILYNNAGNLGHTIGTGSGKSWEGLWCDKLRWMDAILNYDEFKAAVKARFEEVSPILENTFRKNALGESRIDSYLAGYGVSFNKNYEIWDIVRDDVDDSLAVARIPDPTFAANIEYLRLWLENRYNYLSGVFASY